MTVGTRWFVHIGNHKTGTSALQYFMWRNQAVLRRYGVAYPAAGLEAGVSHGPLAEACKPTFHDPAWAARMRRALMSEVQHSGCGTVLLSSEVFLEHPGAAAVLRGWLTEADVTIVVYLRNQVDWLQSVMDEVVRNPWRRFTGQVSDLREYRRRHHDYGKLLQPWISEFGPDRVWLRSYDRARREDHGLFGDLLAVLDVPTDDFDATLPAEHRNTRLPALATEFLRRVNRLPMLNRDRETILTALQDRAGEIAAVGPTCSLVPADFERTVAAECAPANAELFANLAPYRPWTLFEDYQFSDAAAPDAASVCSPAIQEQILALLPKDARAVVVQASQRVSQTSDATVRLPAAPGQREQRLQEIVMRQRMELRQLYGMLDGGFPA